MKTVPRLHVHLEVAVCSNVSDAGLEFRSLSRFIDTPALLVLTPSGHPSLALTLRVVIQRCEMSQPPEHRDGDDPEARPI